MAVVPLGSAEIADRADAVAALPPILRAAAVPVKPVPAPLTLNADNGSVVDTVVPSSVMLEFPMVLALVNLANLFAVPAMAPDPDCFNHPVGVHTYWTLLVRSVYG